MWNRIFNILPPEPSPLLVWAIAFALICSSILIAVMGRGGQIPHRFKMSLLIVVLGLFLAIFGWDVALGNRPIRFYGQVVDGNGAGVAGVAVVAHSTYEKWYSIPVIGVGGARGGQVVSTVTDERGRFSFHNLRGTHFRIERIEKSGWSLLNDGVGSRMGFSLARNRVPALPNRPDLPYQYIMVPPGSAKRVPVAP